MAEDSVRAQLEDRGSGLESGLDHSIDVIEAWGSCQGSKLQDWGMDPGAVPDREGEYEIQAWLVGSICIGARLNPHPLNHRPFFKGSYVRVNDSIWGRAIPELMEDIQKICNSCARAMVDNMSFASGPQVYLWENYLPAGQNASRLYPRKIWRFTDTTNSPDGSRKPIEFFQPDANLEPLLKLYDYFFKMASEVTGIPAYVYGSDQIKQGAASTASGLSMLMNSASKGLKSVVMNIDAGVVRPSVTEQWLHIVMYDPSKAKGDIKIVARASEHLIMQEQLQIRRKEALDTTANAIDMQIIGLPGRAEMLRDYMHGLKFDSSKIVPDRGDLIGSESDQKVMQVIQNISARLGLPPAVLAQYAMGGGAPPGSSSFPPGGASRVLDPAGNPVSGQDNRMMQ
jgi:hypothetical protein